MAIYTDEYTILSELNKYFENGVREIDSYMHKLINSYLEDPFNISEEDLNQIRSFISENKNESIKFDIVTPAPSQEVFEETFEHINPSKLNKPTDRIIKMIKPKCVANVIFFDKTVISYTKRIKLKHVA